jgi:hypothetical protein
MDAQEGKECSDKEEACSKGWQIHLLDAEGEWTRQQADRF